MSKTPDLTYDQLFTANALFAEFYKRMQDEHRLMVSRLDAAGPLSEDQKAIINQWVRSLGELDDACVAQLMDVVMTHPSPGLH